MLRLKTQLVREGLPFAFLHKQTRELQALSFPDFFHHRVVAVVTYGVLYILQ